MSPDRRKEFRNSFDEMGTEQVRQKLSSNLLNLQKTVVAVEWLAEKDNQRFLDTDASQREQMRIAVTANRIAIAALIIATVAAIAAIVSAIFGFLTFGE